MKVGDKIYINYGFDYHKAKIISEHNGEFLFELDWIGIVDAVENRKWYPRKSFWQKLINN